MSNFFSLLKYFLFFNLLDKCRRVIVGCVFVLSRWTDIFRKLHLFITCCQLWSSLYLLIFIWLVTPPLPARLFQGDKGSFNYLTHLLRKYSHCRSWIKRSLSCFFCSQSDVSPSSKSGHASTMWPTLCSIRNLNSNFGMVKSFLDIT